MSAKSFVIRKVLMSANAIAQAATEYSDSVAFDMCEGEMSLLVVSTAGTVTINQQASVDGTNFFDVVNANGTAQGTICTALAVTTGTYVTISPIMTPYTRFKVVETNTAPTVVTLTISFRASRRR